MRDVERIDVMIEKLREAWKLYPDMRLGQLIVCCAETDDIFSVEDDKMQECIENYTEKMRKATGGRFLNVHSSSLQE